AVEVGALQGVAEPVVRGGGRVLDGGAAGQAARGAPDDLDGAAVDVVADLLVGRADGEVGVAVVVEVGGRGVGAPAVALLRDSGDARAVLAEHGALGTRDAVGGAVEDDDLTGVGPAVHIGARGGDRDIQVTVAVEVGR